MTHPEAEVHTLAQRWGQPARIEQAIPLAPGLKEETVTSFLSSRWSEVVMVIRRRADGRVWTMTKESFPVGCFSLLTGGVRQGESIEEALWREIQEETGLKPALERFLAVIHYTPMCAPGDPQAVSGFTSYVFLLEEASGNEPVLSCDEKILSFKAVPPAELLAIASHWQSLAGSSQAFHDWSAWGQFRSTAHRVAAEALLSEGARYA